MWFCLNLHNNTRFKLKDERVGFLINNVVQRYHFIYKLYHAVEFNSESNTYIRTKCKTVYIKDHHIAA